MKSLMPRIVLVPIVLAAITFTATAQAEPPFHEFDPEATRAFEEMVAAHRSLPALSVKSRVQIEVVEGDVASSPTEVEADFLFTDGGRALLQLRGFVIHIGDDAIWAVHEDNESQYFTMGDGGSVYYALMAMFMDLPFPHLAIFFGETDTEELCMQFHSRAPWIRPTSVREEVREATVAAPENDADADVAPPEVADARAVRVITLTSDFETMELVIDPDTHLIESLDLQIVGGGLVKEGAMLVFRQTFENEILGELPGDDALVFDPGEREQVPELRSLRPRVPVAAAAGGNRPGVVAGGMIGREAPPFTLETLDGGAIDLEELRGQVVVLDFWASWCRPCLPGLVALHEVQSWARDQVLPVRVVTINAAEEGDADTRFDNARRFCDRHNISLPVAMDYTDEVAAAYRVQGFPTSFVIRSDGVIHHQHIGAGPGYGEEIKAKILEAIEALEY